MQPPGVRIAVKNILFPTDFSEESEQAIAYARSLAHAYQAKVHVGNVFDMFPYSLHGTPDATAKEAELLRKSEARLNDFLVAHRLDSRVFEPAVLTGEIFPAIEDFSRKRDIDLIILGSRGDIGLRRLFQGSAAEEIYRTAHCPVLVAGPGIREPGRGRVISQILYASDLSAASTAALPYLEFLLERNPNSSVTLAHFMSSDDSRIFYRHQKRRQIENELSRLIPPSLQHHIADVIVEVGPAGAAMTEVAAHLPADLLVLGVRQGGAFVRAATHGWSSLASQVIHRISCPVLTVRSRNNEQ